MEIVNTPESVKFKKLGRANKYPFDEIKPGTSLVIEIKEYEDIGRVKSAFYQYRRYNKLNWQGNTRVVGNNIYITRFK